MQHSNRVLLAGLLLRAIRYQPSCQNRGSASSNKKASHETQKPIHQARARRPASVHACPVHGVVAVPMHARTGSNEASPHHAPPQSPPDISARPAAVARAGPEKREPQLMAFFGRATACAPHVLYCSPSARRGDAQASIHPASSPHGAPLYFTSPVPAWGDAIMAPPRDGSDDERRAGASPRRPTTGTGTAPKRPVFPAPADCRHGSSSAPMHRILHGIGGRTGLHQ